MFLYGPYCLEDIRENEIQSKESVKRYHRKRGDTYWVRCVFVVNFIKGKIKIITYV